LRWRGLCFSFLLATREALRPLLYWHAWHIFCTDLGRPLLESYAKEQVSVKVFAGDEHFDAVAAQLSFVKDLSREEIRSRLHNGAVAIACAHGQFAGYMWMTFVSGKELAFGVNWILQADEALRYESFVLPLWRGLGIHSSLNHALNFYARERGLKRSLASIGAFNTQSLNLAKRARLAKTMTVILVHIRGVKWNYIKAVGGSFDSRFTWSSTRYIPRGEKK
jgi:hypothetical protein